MADHHRAVLGLVSPLATEQVPVVDALGTALAHDVVAGLALPSFDNSAMDGYAVRVTDVSVAPTELPVVADIAAGSGMHAPLPVGAAARIMTGAPVPDGADAVIPVEQTDAGTTVVRIDATPRLGDNIRRAAEDVAPGESVLVAGDELTPSRIALLSALGLADVEVGRRPRVGVVSTGTELVPAGHSLPPGSIHDSNGPLLQALVRRAGAIDVPHPPLPDDPPTAAKALAELAADVDVLVTSGGISAGAYEVVKDVLDAEGGVEFVRVAMQPGMPQGCGRFAGRPVLTLPGNPVSVFVSFELFVRPVLRLLGGHRELDRPRRRGVLREGVRRRPAKEQYLRGTWSTDGTVSSVGGSGSHLMGALAHADVLYVVPMGEGELAAGETVDVIDVSG